MPRAIKNTMEEVSNTAILAGDILDKVNKIIEAVQKQQTLDIEVEIPLGDNLAYLFGKDHLTMNGKVPIIKMNVQVKLPEIN
jgi:hypothetical protein